MATVVLVRHGRSTANAKGLLTGRLKGVHLDERGREQAAALGERLSGVPLAAVVTSPLERCRETAAGIRKVRADQPPLVTDRGLVECDYGDWQGRPLKELARLKLWRTVQSQPSAVTFPAGESMAAMSARAVSAIRRQDSRIAADGGSRAVWVAVSHGDLIKAILADALAMHLDSFQRLHVDPASVSVVRYDDHGSSVLTVNSHSGDLSWLAGPTRKGVVGGGSGPDARVPSRPRSG